MAITSNLMISLHPPPPLLSISKTKPPHSSLHNHSKALTLTSPLSLSKPLLSKRTVLYEEEIHRSTQLWKINATPEEVLPSDTTPLESSQQIVSTSNDDGVGTIISVLLFTAFAALSILTIGVIYLGVTDFLQKRETEKLQKEEESKKKGGRKTKVRARSGPRGFGQKINEDDEFDY